tara:strand:- start:1110 stop:1709 length:600 start_codon:yes stop_codon:yes gene_type:complete
MKQLYCDMDGVLVDFVAGAMDLINGALDNPEKYQDVPEFVQLQERLVREDRTYIQAMDLEKPEYRGVTAEETMPEARTMMKTLIDEAGADWWAALPWMPGGLALWKYIAIQHQPRILTAPMEDCDGCKEGKLRWVKKNLGLTAERVVITDEKFVLAKDNVLIDDFEINTIPWADHGGLAIKHTNAAVTIAEVKEVYQDA